MSRKAVMQHDRDDLSLFSLAAFQTLRLEALDLLDRSLAEGSAVYLERFFEQQIIQEPPPLELLSQIAEDVHQRLLTLRQHQFERRDQLRRALRQRPEFAAVEQIDDEWLDALRAFDDGQPLDGETPVSETRKQAAQLRQDVLLVDHLYTYLMDWLMALHRISVRGAWESFEPDENALVH